MKSHQVYKSWRFLHCALHNMTTKRSFNLSLLIRQSSEQHQTLSESNNNSNTTLNHSNEMNKNDQKRQLLFNWYSSSHNPLSIDASTSLFNTNNPKLLPSESSTGNSDSDND